MRKIHSLRIGIAIIALLSMCAACQDQTEVYEEFIVEGGIIYPGKVQNVQIYAGKERVEVVASKPYDPTVTSIRIYWNFFTDSIVYPITADIKAIDVIIEDLAENTYSFVLQSYDAEGNVSIPVELFGTVYGANYEKRVQNRPILSAVLDSVIDQNLEITFADADISNGAFESVVSYQNIFSEIVSVNVPVSESTISIKDFKSDPMYYTKYLPEEACIDTFFSSVDVINMTK